MIKGTTSDPKFPPKYGAVQVLFFWTNDWSSKGCHGIDWHLIVFCLTKQQNPRVQKAVFFMHCQVSESLWRQWIKDKKAQLTPSSLSWKNTDDDDVSTKMSFQTTDNILRWGFLELIIFIDKTNSSTTINDRQIWMKRYNLNQEKFNDNTYDTTEYYGTLSSQKGVN